MLVTIQKIEPDQVDQFSDLVELFDNAFEQTASDQSSESYWREMLHQDIVRVFVALVDESVVGGLIAYVLPTYSSRRPSVYLYDIAVKEAYQRQGIGRQLLTTLTQYARTIGAGEVFVQTDADDADAIAFYEATGGQAQQVVHFTYPLTT